jgi:trimeric autotransporter adhesin
VLGSFATASGDNSTAIGFNARATNANDVALGANTTANGPDATANYTTPNSVVNGYAFTVQQAASGAVAVGNRQITQVADGEISATSLDAVNGSQVFKITQAIELQISGLGSSPASPPNNSAPTTVITEANPYLSVNSKGPQATATGTNAVAVGSAAVAAGNNSVALGSGSIATRDDSVSVGATGAERQITNVAAGTQATDAVNVQQLNSAVGGLQQGMNSIARNAYSGIAAAAALAAIPDVDAGKTIAVGVGTGNYQGYQAWSLGATARLAENIKMRAGVSQSSGGTTWNLGAAMEW